MMRSSIIGAAGCAVCEGRCASRPRCDSGSAAMKITSSTSNTSIIGVILIADDGFKTVGFTMASLEHEIDGDRHDHGYRHAVEQRRREFPLAHCLERRLIQQRDRSQQARVD